MKNIHYFSGPKHMAFALSAILLLAPLCGLLGQSNPYGLRADDVFRCGHGSLTIVATYDTSIEDFIPENVMWYEQPFYGEPIHSGLTFETPILEFSKTYFIDYIFTDEHGQEGCGICDRIAVRANISYETIENRISYPANAFCKTPGTYLPTIAGIPGGTFSYVVVGGGSGNLTLNPVTGEINPETSEVATYEISYTPPTVPGCPTTPATWHITITDLPEVTTIAYSGTQTYCAFPGAGYEAVVFNEGYSKPANAFFSSAPSGLSLNRNTGQIDLSNSQTGEYNITYTVPGGGGCPPHISHHNSQHS